jgi:Ca-activated chloride channel family protein
VAFADGRVVAQQATLLPCGTASDRDVLARVGAHARLAELDTEAAQAVAVQYQLVTEQTSCVLVHARAAGEKAEGVPVLRKVPQVLAAGWGGTGAVSASVSACYDAPSYARRAGSFMTQELQDFFIPCDDNVSNFSPPTSAPRDWSALVSALNARCPDTVAGELDLCTLADLQALGVAADTVDALRAIVDDGTPEQAVVIGFLVALLGTPAGSQLTRHVRRLIRQAERHVALGAVAQQRIDALTAGSAP